MRDPLDVLMLLHTAAEAVRDALAALPDETRRQRAPGHPDQFALDVAADRAACAVLAGADVDILSEESGRSGTSREVVVVVDPVDGSTNCSRRVGFYGPSLCAVDADGPLAAVVWNLATDRRFSAVRGKGAAVNGVPLPPTDEGDRDVTFVATGDPCPYLERLPSPGVQPIYTRLSGSSAHDLCLVADGTFDGYVDCVNVQSPWDYLGAALVLTETGGVLRERNGVALADLSHTRPRQIIAAHSGHQFDTLCALVETTHTSGGASH
jgi:myo-inositol-1(or 4)-monophosphatase